MRTPLGSLSFVGATFVKLRLSVLVEPAETGEISELSALDKAGLLVLALVFGESDWRTLCFRELLVSSLLRCTPVVRRPSHCETREVTRCTPSPLED